MLKFIKRFRYKHMDLREKGIKYVQREFGNEYVDEFCEKYDNINRGIPIGGYVETVVFLALVETIRKDELKC